jgi:cyclopropane fatty-acyl-phospholipid synthase-like methyltransferase
MFEDSYIENSEVGASNLEHKVSRLKSGGSFEPLDIVLVNKAVVSLLQNEKNILEIGSGTGLFASLASENKQRHITASELDDGALAWAKENRLAENIKYCQLTLEEIQKHSFDLAVCIEVIEHVADFSTFLDDLSKVSNKAIITTPNKSRTPFDSVANSPTFLDHVREWTAGEFYWVLKAFYKDVALYEIPKFNWQVNQDVKIESYSPKVIPCGILSKSPQIIAVCKN